MAKKIKSFWVRLGAMFFTLYFIPLSNFVRTVLGMPCLGGAVAGTLTAPNGVDTIECGGVASTTVTSGQVYTCTCETDATKKMDVVYECIAQGEYFDSSLNGTQEVTACDFYKFGCYVPDECTEEGATQDCSTSSRYGTQTCRNSKWTSCVYGECKSGYIMVNNSCFAGCSITNGAGYETDQIASSSSSAV